MARALARATSRDLSKFSSNVTISFELRSNNGQIRCLGTNCGVFYIFKRHEMQLNRP